MGAVDRIHDGDYVQKGNVILNERGLGDETSFTGLVGQKLSREAPHIKMRSNRETCNAAIQDVRFKTKGKLNTFPIGNSHTGQVADTKGFFEQIPYDETFEPEIDAFIKRIRENTGECIPMLGVAAFGGYTTMRGLPLFLNMFVDGKSPIRYTTQAQSSGCHMQAFGQKNPEKTGGELIEFPFPSNDRAAAFLAEMERKFPGFLDRHAVICSAAAAQKNGLRMLEVPEHLASELERNSHIMALRHNVSLPGNMTFFMSVTSDQAIAEFGLPGRPQMSEIPDDRLKPMTMIRYTAPSDDVAEEIDRELQERYGQVLTLDVGRGGAREFVHIGLQDPEVIIYLLTVAERVQMLA